MLEISFVGLRTPLHKRGVGDVGARVRAVLRRSGSHVQPPQILTVGDLEIDLERRLVKRGGELVALTRTEWMLLHHLAANPGKVMLNTELLTKVWGTEYREDFQYLRVWVSRLRRKLGDFELIRTFQGIGYMLVLQPGEDTEAPSIPGRLDRTPEVEAVADPEPITRAS